MSKPKRISIAYTIVVEHEVPEDFPLTSAEVKETVEWRVNDWRDGRMPFDTEMMMRAASESARWQLSEAIFQHYARAIDKHFGNANEHMTARDAFIARLEAKVKPLGIPEREVQVDVKLWKATE